MELTVEMLMNYLNNEIKKNPKLKDCPITVFDSFKHTWFFPRTVEFINYTGEEEDCELQFSFY